uniref:Uncharacterized protein n=1 Tax=Tanacetum cinerariifolium TaxID=118510 RepID=A0A699TA47_TANCI|nr:hypothetical protein [Tanacetum cinerariifolium]
MLPSFCTLNSSTAKPSSHPSSSQEEKKGGKPWERKVDWKPLDDLVKQLVGVNLPNSTLTYLWSQRNHHIP